MTFPKNEAAPVEENRPECSTKKKAHEVGRYSDTTFLDQGLYGSALYYAGVSWLVFLLGPRGKNPRIPSDPAKAAAQGWDAPGHGHLDATSDLTTVHRLWTKCPMGNIGMPTGPVSGFLVIDIDGVEAARTFDAMGNIGHPLIQKSARGWHLFYAWSAACDGIRNSAGFLGDKIDVRGDGGYVALAPSVHRSGFVYRWQNWGHDPSPAPDWLIERLQKGVRRHAPARMAGFEPVGFITARAKKALTTMARRIETAPFGEQEKTLAAGAWLAKRLADEGKADRAYAARCIVNAGLLMPSQDGKRPWRPIDVERKVDRVVRRAAA